MNQVIAIFRKEFLQLRRDPRLIVFIIMMPVVFLILFGLVLKLEPANLRMAFVDQEHSFFSNEVRTNIWSEGYFQLYEVNSKKDLIEEIRTGRAKAGLFIPNTFTSELTENQQPHLTMFVDGTMPSLATSMESNATVITSNDTQQLMYFTNPDAENVVIPEEPFILDFEVLFNPEKYEPWFFLPGVVGVLIMQIALILTSIAIVREKETNTLEQLLVSPISKLGFVLGKTLPYLTIAFIDFYFILGLGWWVFDLPWPVSHLLLLLLVTVFVFGLIALGLAISTVSQTQQQAVFLAIFFLLPSILLSGFIFPLEAMPFYIRPLSYLLPFTYFVEAIRGILLKGNSFSELFVNFAAFSGFAVAFTLVSIVRFRKTID